MLGNGYGGFVALQMAIRHPGIAAKFILADCGAAFSEPGREAFRNMAAASKAKGLAAITDVAMRRLFAPEFQAAHPDLMADRRAGVPQDRSGSVSRRLRRAGGPRSRPELAKVKVPVLVLVGEHDEATPPPMSHELAALLAAGASGNHSGLRPCPATAVAAAVSGCDRRFPADRMNSDHEGLTGAPAFAGDLDYSNLRNPCLQVEQTWLDRLETPANGPTETPPAFHTAKPGWLSSAIRRSFLPIGCGLLNLGASMRRREFIALTGTAALSFPRLAYSQTIADLPLVAVLAPTRENTELARQIIPALRKGLQQEGLTEGKHYSFAMRLANGEFARLPSLAKELGALKPRVVVASSMAIPPAVKRFLTCRWFLLVLLTTPSRWVSSKLCAPGWHVDGKRDERGRWRGDHDPKARRLLQGTCSGFDTTWHDSAQPPAQ